MDVRISLFEARLRKGIAIADLGPDRIHRFVFGLNDKCVMSVAVLD